MGAVGCLMMIALLGWRHHESRAQLKADAWVWGDAPHLPTVYTYGYHRHAVYTYGYHRHAVYTHILG